MVSKIYISWFRIWAYAFNLSHGSDRSHFSHGNHLHNVHVKHSLVQGASQYRQICFLLVENLSPHKMLARRVVSVWGKHQIYFLYCCIQSEPVLSWSFCFECFCFLKFKSWISSDQYRQAKYLIFHDANNSFLNNLICFFVEGIKLLKEDEETVIVEDEEKETETSPF